MKTLSIIALAALLCLPAAAQADPATAQRLASPAAQARLLALAEPDCDRLRTEHLACLACNLYHEARSEGRDGMRLVGKVTMNRVASPAFPDRICEVVWHRRAKGRAQFSWTDDGRTDLVREPDAWRDAVANAAVMIHDHFDPYVTARIDGRSYGPDLLWYHADSVSPDWSRHLQKAAAVGRHVAYRAPPEPPQEAPST